MPKRERTRFFLILAATFAVMLALNLLTPMIADDYMYAFRFDTGERVTAVWQIFPSLAAHMNVLNGRVAADFFVQLFLLLPHAAFAVVNAFLYLALLLGLYALARETDAHYDWKLLLAVAGATFLLPPVFGQTFLWVTGAPNYLWCEAMLAWLLVPFADAMFRGKTLTGGWRIALLAMGALWFGDISENLGATAILLMGLCMLWQRSRGRRVPFWMPLFTACALAGWLFLLLAPANSHHIATSSGTLSRVAEHFQAALDMWLAHGLWLTLGYVALYAYARHDNPEARDRLAAGMGLMVGSVLCNFAMTASDYYPERAFTGTVLLLILAYAITLGALRGKAKPILRDALALGLALVMALEMAGALPNAYNRYALAQERARQVQAARDAGTANVTTFGIRGLSRFDGFYHLNELTEDVNYFPNVNYAKYYGIESIVVEGYE